MSSKSMLIAALAVFAALTAGCSSCVKDEPRGRSAEEPAASAAAASVSASAAAASAAPAAAAPPGPSTGAAVPAGTFTKFFPKDGQGGVTLVIAQDIVGLAEAKLGKEGKPIAVLSIADAQRLAFVMARFEEASDKLQGFPMMTSGDHQTSVLVKGRYQVKVTSQTLDHDARKAILMTVDLKGLDAL